MSVGLAMFCLTCVQAKGVSIDTRGISSREESMRKHAIELNLRRLGLPRSYWYSRNGHLLYSRSTLCWQRQYLLAGGHICTRGKALPRNGDFSSNRLRV